MAGITAFFWQHDGTSQLHELFIKRTTSDFRGTETWPFKIYIWQTLRAMADYTPSGRGPQLIAVYSFFLALTTVTIALRVYVRSFLVNGFGLDDWSAIIGWVSLLADT